ncbi:MAG: filamentous hemagglutinin N-terminal domain-containing protein [Rivularia sp. (in: Bacteria)]|nr:filamentous hemagglutinin N-terminal domain-containing protein [Rivularia sp. MS3]
MFPKIAASQVSRDGSLNTNVITNDQLNFNINDGNRVGNNLFHSFQEFSVPSGGSAVFNNPADVVNIINRVTGGNVSNINGLIRATGNANLFLINPSGIVFGEDAKLDIGGSFFGSTADSINFADGTVFSALDTQQEPLLTISTPLGLQYGQNPGSITVKGTGSNLIPSPIALVDDRNVGLQVRKGKTLALVGGNVIVEGGNLTAGGGRIEVGSVASNSNVSLTPGNEIWQLGYEKVNNFQNIEFSQIASADVSSANPGSIKMVGNSIIFSEGSTLLGLISGTNTIPGTGNINIQAKDTVQFSGIGDTGLPALLLTQVNPDGENNAANISIKTSRLLLDDGALILSSTLSSGNAGKINIDASESIELNGGNIFGGGSSISTQVDPGGTANAGELTVNTNRLRLNDGAQITSTTRGNGNGGNVFLNASESIELAGIAEDGLSSRIFSQVNRGGVGDSGTLTIITRNLILRDGAQIGSGTFGEGNGNDMKITASETLELSGVDIDGIGSAISTQTSLDAIGNAGNLTIETGRLSLNDEAFITSSTNNIGNSGDLKIQASDSVTVDNGSFIAARASEGGAAGNLDVITNKLIVDNLGELRVSGKGQFPAGSLTINADSILLDNQGSLTAVTPGGSEGNISLKSQDVVLRRNSRIATNVDNGTGGNINIDTGVLALVENSEIVAQAIEGRGGNINITTQGLFQSPGTRIDASSQLGIDGVIQIDTPDIDPSQQITELPEGIIDTENLVATSCLIPSSRNRGKFIITGSGGLANTPTGVSSSNFATYSVPKNNQQQALNSQKVSSLVIESEGIFTLEDGSVVLGRRCNYNS